MNGLGPKIKYGRELLALIQKLPALMDLYHGTGTPAATPSGINPIDFSGVALF
jgi:hypothetical protein